jgi:hypothetical protein
MTTAQWIAVTLLAPFWWGLGLLLLAWLADLVPSWRHRVFAVFNRLERARCEEPMAVRNRLAA